MTIDLNPAATNWLLNFTNYYTSLWTYFVIILWVVFTKKFLTVWKQLNVYSPVNTDEYCMLSQFIECRSSKKKVIRIVFDLKLKIPPKLEENWHDRELKLVTKKKNSTV